MSAPGEGLQQRVGDRDRERAAGELRLHHLEGRLDDDELEGRLGATYAARTVGDLVAVLDDLPERALRGIAPARFVPTTPQKPGGFGLLPFSFVHDLPTSPADTYAHARDSLAGDLARSGYGLVERSEGEALLFEHEERPGWVPLVCVFAFPFGLLALGVKRRTRIRVDVMPTASGGSRIRISGEARRPIRKAFANLMV